jgi:Flp pilus assembly pilin Flp
MEAGHARRIVDDITGWKGEDMTSTDPQGAQRTRTAIRGVGQRGASAVEYGIVVMLITAVIVFGVALLGARTSGNFECTGESITSRSTAC